MVQEQNMYWKKNIQIREMVIKMIPLSFALECTKKNNKVVQLLMRRLLKIIRKVT